MQRVPSDLRAETEALMTGTKSSTPQKRNNLKLKGVSRAVIDELEALSSSCKQHCWSFHRALG